MKHLVNLLQIMIIAAVLYPVYYIWDTDRVDGLCAATESGMSLSTLKELAAERNMSINEPQTLDPQGIKWLIEIPARSAISTYKCEVKGAGQTVASAKLVKGG